MLAEHALLAALSYLTSCACSVAWSFLCVVHNQHSQMKMAITGAMMLRSLLCRVHYPFSFHALADGCKDCLLPLQANVVAPNKHSAAHEPMFRGHLLESETYIGGKVEALESGVFRSDLPTRFTLDAAAYQVHIPARHADCIPG
jgi:hypothetical protein